MKKINIYKIFNSLFRIFLIYLIIFVWINFLSRKYLLSIVLSLFLALSIEFTIYYFKNKLNDKKIINDNEKKDIEGYINSLIFNDEKYVINYFFELCKQQYNAEKKSNYILIKHEKNDVALYPFFTFRTFSTDDLIFALNKIKNTNTNKLVICAKNFDNETVKLSKRFDIKILLLNSIETYEKLMKEFSYYPEKLFFKKEDELNYNILLSNALNKKKTKGYFLSSIALLFSSFFVRYSIFYVIMSTILLALSLVSFSNPKFNKKINEQILS